MSLWAVKDADGWFWDFTDEGFYEENDTRTAGIPNRDYANQIAKEHNGTLTEYMQKPAPIVVSEEEAEMLEQAKDDYCAASVISAYSTEHIGAMGQDRLIRAYVNGYTVANEKKYLLPMDGTLEENDGYNNYQIYAYCYKGRWLTDECETDPAYPHFTVTQKELETAPAWVKAIKPVEVTEDEQ